MKLVSITTSDLPDSISSPPETAIEVVVLEEGERKTKTLKFVMSHRADLLDGVEDVIHQLLMERKEELMSQISVKTTFHVGAS